MQIIKKFIEQIFIIMQGYYSTCVRPYGTKYL
jgi:hypothetical protein